MMRRCPYCGGWRSSNGYGNSRQFHIGFGGFHHGFSGFHHGFFPGFGLGFGLPFFDWDEDWF